MQIIQSRRDFLASLSAAGAAGVLGARASLADEGPPETTTIRLRPRSPPSASRRWYVAEELLRAEGFTDVRYVRRSRRPQRRRRWSRAASSTSAPASPARVVYHLDAGVPITALAGVHAGCFELFAHEPIRSISDLKGKRVGIQTLELERRICYLAIMAAHVGLDPQQDIDWVMPARRQRHGAVRRTARSMPSSAFRPSRRSCAPASFGRVILNTATDKPWSQYFCCMVVGNRDFVRDHPVATKRVLRAILKAADFCAAEPERAARQLVDGGFARALRLRAPDADASCPTTAGASSTPRTRCGSTRCACTRSGMIKSSPNELIAEGTDWRFLNELKRELKA